jgi:penicillin-binding protein 1A
MMGLLRAVIEHGTGAAAAQLKHPLGGKTGTTSDFTDAWFLGFSPSITCGVWVGYDSNQSLGEKETGARAALPIWINVMRVAIAGKDDERFPGDEQNGQMLRAGAEPPAKLSTARAAGSSAKLVNVHPAVKPAGVPSTAQPQVKPAMPPETPPAKSLVQHVAAPPAAKPQVKPALPAEPAQAKPKVVLKPVLNAKPDKPSVKQQK